MPIGAIVGGSSKTFFTGLHHRVLGYKQSLLYKSI